MTQNFNFSLPIITDIITVALLVFFALRGRRRGLVKTIAGILVLILAFWGAGFLANLTTPYLSKTFVEPRISSSILPQTQALTKTKPEAIKKPDGLSDSISQILLKVGIPKNTVTEVVGNFKWDKAGSIDSAINDISNTISNKITYSIAYFIYFIILLILLSIIVKLLNLIAKIPGLNFINKTGGFLFGLLFGYLGISLITMILVNTGLLLSRDTVDHTVILRSIINTNPLSLLVKNIR